MELPGGYMEHLVQSIEKSIMTENWYSAISMALTIPDICGWLETPTDTSQKRYEAWFNKYLLSFYTSTFHGPNFTFLSGRDCYALRCAFLHEGTDEILRQRAREVITRFVFSTTGSHRCMFESILLLNVQVFCAELCLATRQWIHDNATNLDIQERLKELLLIRTEGFTIIPGVFVQ
jgi:hypothetical protein